MEYKSAILERPHLMTILGTSEATPDESEAPVQAETDEAGTVEDAEETPAATTDEAVEAATPSTDNTASKTRVNTMVRVLQPGPCDHMSLKKS